MALSKEFYLDEIRSKYPNSYNESLKDLEVKELEDMLDFLEGALGKADGGSIGIEVLFGPKRDEYQTGGRIGFNMGGAQFTSGGNISPGTDKRGNVRDDNPFTGGGGGGGPPSIINPSPVIKPPVVTDNFDNRGFLSDVRIKNQKKYLDILNRYKPDDFDIRNRMDGTSNLTEEESEFIDRYGIGKIYDDLSKQNVENFMDIREGIAPKINPSEITSPREYEFAEVTDIDLKRAKEPMTKMMDYDTYKSVNPSSKITPYEFEELKKGNITETGTFTAADGGRVGFFMGGPALEGQALQIYNSMNAYGFTDQEIADALSARGLYTPAGSGTTQPEQVTGIINQQIQTGGGRDDNQTGFGKFGNLDPKTERTFVKDVYTIDKNAAPGAPMTGSFKPTEVTGYLNVNTGNYQTFEGKNINHAGLNIKPGIIAVAEALGLGPIDETQFTGLPYAEGQIAGTFTGKNLSDFNPLNLFKKQQATVAEINAMNQKAIKDMQAKKAAEEAAARRELENRIISGGANISGGGDGGGGNITTSAGTFAPGDYSDVAGTLADPREKMDYYRDGGLATMFTRRR